MKHDILFHVKGVDMNTTINDYNFELKETSIAQKPLENRSSSKLMTVNMEDDTIKHEHFSDILAYFQKGDCLVLNNSKVLPSRLYGEKDTGARIEVLMLREVEHTVWEVLARKSKRLHVGTVLYFSEHPRLQGTIVEKFDEGIHHIAFDYDTETIYETLDLLGEMPLPPYITEPLKDKNRYQTVYARHLGSSAAPTAGLHFTDELLEQIKSRGVEIAYVTLHVGLGTFRPVSVENIEEHTMHEEHYSLTEENVRKIKSAQRVIAVGTTTVRTLESIVRDFGDLIPCESKTSIFIREGFKFNVVDALITNFHLPKSTLIMLISAFYNREKVLKAYETAVEEEYRFFSFGDAMFLYRPGVSNTLSENERL